MSRSLIGQCRRALPAVLFWLLLATLPRALLPAGLMPQLDDGGPQLSYCLSDGGDLLASLNDPDRDPETQHPVCPFALATAAVLGSAGPLLGGLVAGTSLPGTRPATCSAQAGFPPLPPAQGPPTSFTSIC